MTRLVDVIVKVRVETGEHDPDGALYDAEDLIRTALDGARTLSQPDPAVLPAEVRSFEMILARVSED